jgi:hypothetical protein
MCGVCRGKHGNIDNDTYSVRIVERATTRKMHVPCQIVDDNVVCGRGGYMCVFSPVRAFENGIHVVYANYPRGAYGCGLSGGCALLSPFIFIFIFIFTAAVFLLSDMSLSHPRAHDQPRVRALTISTFHLPAVWRKRPPPPTVRFSPCGSALAQAPADGAHDVLVDIRPDDPDYVTVRLRNPFWAVRQPELYASLTHVQAHPSLSSPAAADRDM